LIKLLLLFVGYICASAFFRSIYYDDEMTDWYVEWLALLKECIATRFLLGIE